MVPPASGRLRDTVAKRSYSLRRTPIIRKCPKTPSQMSTWIILFQSAKWPMCWHLYANVRRHMSTDISTDCTKFTCPDCGGAIERITEGGLVQYRCRIG